MTVFDELIYTGASPENPLLVTLAIVGPTIVTFALMLIVARVTR